MVGLGLAVGAVSAAGVAAPSTATRRLAGDDPFALGVASGDPLPDAVVIWTRLVVDPCAPDGELPPGDRDVDWQVALDERFRTVVRAGTVRARRPTAHAVKVDVTGLPPGADLWYRFRVDGHVSPTGRTRTAPLAFAPAGALTVAWASCQNWSDGHYPAYTDMAAHAPDVVLHLGDYIYEKPIPTQNGRQPGQSVPASARFEAETLDDYRERYALYKSDPALREAHRMSPFIVTMDDHEVDNNWAATIPEDGMDTARFMRRRAAAFQAWWEHMPVRLPAPNGGRLRMYRRFRFGTLAQFDLLDTRQYRDDQVNGDNDTAQNSATADPHRTLLGSTQERWLAAGLDTSTRWSVLAHQVPIADLARIDDGVRSVSMDGWSGYQAQRRRLLDAVRARRVDNLVSLVGDIHRNVVADIRTDYDRASPTLGVEFAGTSISSGGDGSDSDATDRALKSASPHVRFGNAQRGYVLGRITERAWESEFRVSDRVSDPAAPLRRRAVVTVPARDGGGRAPVVDVV
nr:alkaline phosphatase D family protein [Gordonia soli]